MCCAVVQRRKTKHALNNKNLRLPVHNFTIHTAELSIMNEIRKNNLRKINHLIWVCTENASLLDLTILKST